MLLVRLSTSAADAIAGDVVNHKDCKTILERKVRRADKECTDMNESTLNNRQNIADIEFLIWIIDQYHQNSRDFCLSSAGLEIKYLEF